MRRAGAGSVLRWAPPKPAQRARPSLERRQDQRSLPNSLVSDMYITAAGIFGLGLLHHDM